MGKGMELPINTVVILIIGLVVITVVLYWFIFTSDKAKIELQYEKNWQQACSSMNTMGCQTANYYEISINGLSFGELCSHALGTSDPILCCEACCGKGKCS